MGTEALTTGLAPLTLGTARGVTGMSLSQLLCCQDTLPATSPRQGQGVTPWLASDRWGRAVTWPVPWRGTQAQVSQCLTGKVWATWTYPAALQTRAAHTTEVPQCPQSTVVAHRNPKGTPNQSGVAKRAQGWAARGSHLPLPTALGTPTRFLCFN